MICLRRYTETATDATSCIQSTSTFSCALVSSSFGNSSPFCFGVVMSQCADDACTVPAY